VNETAIRRPSSAAIIVPVYNGGPGLARCLSALVAARSPVRHELIVVDNGSTDGSAAVASGFGARVLHCPGPSGPGAARNTGAAATDADILVFVDADVVVSPDAVSQLVAHFHRDSGVAAVFGSYDDSPHAVNFLSQYKNLLHYFTHQHGNREARTFWGGCGAVLKKAFDELGGFDQRRYPKPSIEDIELGFRLHARGYRIVLDPSIQVKHLKEWRMGSLLRADICYRAIPWAELILERQGLVNDLNLKISQRISAGLVGGMLVLAPAALLHPAIGFLLIALLGAFLVLNRDLFTFFLRRKGLLFTAATVPMHMLYFLYSAATFTLMWGWHVVRARGVGKRMKQTG
jgi:GT2 family glycosyltransferase